uniref:Uncharacterized protein n=2 Tax=unclassified Caudoviricetes TaxID=2788787 RepID=A0A8S5V3K9_9CAUD|nr:MAG TPA: hypothetical protein [Podoviridae sp. ctoqT5]DAG01329.1 MAG TPA: hypothetical protein [Myoviridae sp. ctk6V34]
MKMYPFSETSTEAFNSRYNALKRTRGGKR